MPKLVLKIDEDDAKDLFIGLLTIALGGRPTVVRPQPKTSYQQFKEDVGKAGGAVKDAVNSVLPIFD